VQNFEKRNFWGELEQRLSSDTQIADDYVESKSLQHSSRNCMKNKIEMKKSLRRRNSVHFPRDISSRATRIYFRIIAHVAACFDKNCVSHSTQLSTRMEVISRNVEIMWKSNRNCLSNVSSSKAKNLPPQL
jgi:hypothetical protein